MLGIALFEVLVWPHEVEPSLYSWNRVRAHIIKKQVPKI